jgi:Fe-S oxidoreductase
MQKNTNLNEDKNKRFKLINFESTDVDFTFPGKKYNCYPSEKKDLEICQLPFARDWDLTNWKLPTNWKEIAIKKMGKLAKKYRSFQLFMDICTGCGSCADKCQFFLGTRDPKNMPVKRSELLRSVYRRYYTNVGKLFGNLVGARELTKEVLEEWYRYFYQCSECRRCSVFCPFGIDTAEITMMGREILASIGVTTRYITQVQAKVHSVGNNLGIPPPAMINSVQFASEEIKDDWGVDVDIPINKIGAEILFVTPSADFFGDPHWYTFLGYIKLFHQIGLDYTLSTYASEGGNFGLFLSYDEMKKTNKRIVDEAKRLGVKWILGGECGHMWRVLHSFMDTINGPMTFLEDPVSPITGTKFEKAASSKIVHICEFTADLIKHNKLKYDPSLNDKYKVTFSDSCNPVRGMGLIEEPRYILKKVCNNYIEMNPEFNKEKTYCCGAGGGLLTDEIMELRMMAGGPKSEAVRATKANFTALICAICKSNYTHLMDYWKVSSRIGGVHELVGNALLKS